LDRVIAHEMVHAVMARNMNNSQLPGWFTEGTAEFIHGADERVKGDASIIGLESNFIQLFKTTAGSPSTSAGYSVSYIAVKLLDKEIRNHGGAGIKEVFDQLKTGKTLDQALIAVSATHTGLAGDWNNLSTFETHFKAVGFAQYTQLLNLDDLDTGSIAGSDYGNASLNASAVISNAISGPSHNFNLIVPDQYISTPEIDGVLESIGFSSGTEWDLTRVTQEVLKPTNGDDVIHAFDTDDVLGGSKGNDQLFGYAGNDVYRYALGDGNDVIVDSAGNDQIEFGEGILAADIELTRDSSSNLVATLKDRSTITVRDAFTAAGELSSNSIESIKFFNGDVWNSVKILEEANRVRDNIVLGSSGKDSFSGTEGVDIFIGGLGDDFFENLGDRDIYKYNLGDGQDEIFLSSGDYELWFGEGILSNEVWLTRSLGADLTVNFIDGGSVYLSNFLSSNNGVFSEKGRFRFQNGEVWNLRDIKNEFLIASSTENDDFIHSWNDNETINGYGGSDYIDASGGDDVLIGGLGSDHLDGGEGNDSYHYSLGDGLDTINGSYGIDRLILGAGINEEDVKLQRVDGWSIMVNFRQGGSVLLSDMFILGGLADYENEGAFSDVAALEKIIFSNGIEWDLDTIKEKLKPIAPDADGILWGFDSNDAIDGSGGGDEIYGLSGNDTLTGGSGNDTLYGGSGNDQLAGGIGVDHLYGDEGDDRYIVNTGEGYTFISDSGGNDVLQFNGGIDPEELMVSRFKESRGNFTEEQLIFHDRKGQVVVVNLSGYYNWGAEKNIERVEFANGDIWNSTIIQEKITYTESLANVAIQKDTAYTFSPGLSEGTHITGTLAKSIHGGSGNDTLVSILADDTVVAMKGGEGIDSFIINHGVRRILDFNYSSEFIVFSNVASLDDLDFHVTNNFGIQNEYNPRSILHLTDKIGAATAQIGTSIVGYDSSYHDVQAYSLYSSNAETKFIVLADGSSHSMRDLFAIKNIATISDDNIRLLSDSDIIDADSGNDFISGGSGNDTLSGGDGNDQIYGGQGNDQIDGGDHNDELTGGYGNDYVAGGEGNDTLDGVYGLDTLVGGAGDDLLYSRRHHDDLAGYNAERLKTTYIYQLGDGNDTIFDRDGDDKIIFGQGIAADDIEFEKIGSGSSLGDHLLIKVRQGGSILIQHALSNDAPEYGFIEQIEFAGGMSWDKNTIVSKIFGSDQVPPSIPSAEFNSLGTIVIGYAEANSLIEVKSLSGLLLGSATTDSASGAYTITLATALIDKESVHVTARDAAGNISPSKTIIAPDLTVPSIPTASFDATGKVITGVAETGSVVVVKDATNTNTLGTVTADATTGAYSITLPSALINKETVNVTATDAAGNVSVARTIVASDGTAPNPIVVIQAENYTSMNGVQNESTSDVGGQNVGYIDVNDWMAYNNAPFNVPAEGRYRVTYRVASLNGGGQLTLKELSTDAALGSIAVPKTSGWQNWVDVTQEITLSGGEHNFKLAADVGGFNINWFKLEPLASVVPDTTPPVQPTAAFDSTGRVISGIAEAGSVVVVKDASNTNTLGTVTADVATGAYAITLSTALINQESVNITATDAAGNVSVARAVVAPDTAAPNQSALVIQAENYTSMNGVQNESTSDVGGGQNTGYIDAGDWMAYNNAAFEVPAEGRYRVTYRVASLNGGGQLTLKELSTDAALGSISISKTSGWQNWVDVTQEITLSGGVHNFKLAADIGGFNINWFKLESLESTSSVTTILAKSRAMIDPQDSVLTGIVEAGNVVVDKDANITSTLGTVTAAEASRLKTDYESVHYVSSNDALVQAMASFVSGSGVDTRYRSTQVEQSPLMIAVGS
jgi:Ca2+-binding RTX toxin-like protein